MANQAEIKFTNGKSVILDRDKTYCMGVIGKSFVSKWIQKESQRPTIPINETYSHVLALFFNDTELHFKQDEFIVTESHLRDGGVVCKTLPFWFNENRNASKIELFEYPVAKDGLVTYAKLKVNYGWQDVTNRLIENKVVKLASITFPNDQNRVHCAELISENDRSRMKKLTGKRADLIFPSDFNVYTTLYHSKKYDLTGCLIAS